MLFSIVICTYNRLDHVRNALDSVFKQTLPPEAFEVILVDNASTDGTADFVQTLAREHGNVRYVFEARQGLAGARNTGWQTAQGTYVAFLDDDAKASANWLETAASLYDRTGADYHCVGGPIHPFYLNPQPDWWLDKYEIRTRGDAERYLRKGEFFSGSNMIWRRQTLETYQGFDAGAGMKGNQLGMGEETALFRRIWEREGAPHFLYSPQLVVYHWVPAEKMTMGYIVKRALANGQFEGEFTLKQVRGLVKRARAIGSTMRTLAIQVPSILLKRRQYKTTENWFFENCFIPIQNVGKLMRLLGLKVSVSQRKTS